MERGMHPHLVRTPAASSGAGLRFQAFAAKRQDQLSGRGADRVAVRLEGNTEES